MLLAHESWVEGQWIVTREASTRLSWESLLAQRDVKLLQTFGPQENFALVHSAVEPRLTSFSKSITAVQRNFLYRAEGVDPKIESSWGLKNTGQILPTLGPGTAGFDIGAEDAWALQKQSDVIVAIIDSGVEISHEDLKNNLWVNPKEIPNNGIDDDGNGFVDDIHGWNFVDKNADVSSRSQHGTFCAGIVGASGSNGLGSAGVAWKIPLLVAKFMDYQGTSVNAIAAIQYAVEQGARVINASWGEHHFDLALEKTIQWAGSRDVLFVAAAGNDGRDNDIDKQKTFPASYSSPNILSVMAYDNQKKIWPFSNFGKGSVHLGAPGVGVFSTEVKNGYGVREGTSFAAPFVSGVAALLWSFEPALTLKELKERLIESSEPVSLYSEQWSQSGGMVNAYNALKNIHPNRTGWPTHWQRHPVSLSTPHPYGYHNPLVFEIKHPGAKALRVHFVNFKTEDRADFVLLKDVRGETAGQYSGDRGSFWSAPVQGNRVVIEFRSNHIIHSYGFFIDAYETD